MTIERYAILLSSVEKQGVLNSLEEEFENSIQLPEIRDPMHYRLKQYHGLSIPLIGNNCTNTVFNSLPQTTRNVLSNSNSFTAISPHHMAVALRIQSLVYSSKVKRLRNIN